MRITKTCARFVVSAMLALLCLIATAPAKAGFSGLQTHAYSWVDTLMTSPQNYFPSVSTPTAGDLTVVGVTTTKVGGTGPITLVDYNGLSLSRVAALASGDWRIEFFYNLNTAANNNAAKFTVSGWTGTAYIVMSYWRVTPTGLVYLADAESLTSSNPGTGTNAIATPSLDLSGSTDGIIFSIHQKPTGTSTAGTGFTSDFTQLFGNIRAEHMSVSANAAATWTNSVGTGDFPHSAIAFRIGGGASGAQLLMRR